VQRWPTKYFTKRNSKDKQGKKEKTKEKPRHPKMEGRVQPGSTNAEIEPEHILLGPKIGDGSFGTVYKVPPNPNPQSKRVKGG
jgi:hypothetical protein